MVGCRQIDWASMLTNSGLLVFATPCSSEDLYLDSAWGSFLCSWYWLCRSWGIGLEYLSRPSGSIFPDITPVTSLYQHGCTGWWYLKAIHHVQYRWYIISSRIICGILLLTLLSSCFLFFQTNWTNVNVLLIISDLTVFTTLFNLSTPIVTRQLYTSLCSCS